ncbi:MAG: TetR/AcrR family transcriptional regulator [Bacteroidia bacterium]|nr:TetR/AcrR family transcriptional regulator [Bacteroidia bacterium]
MGIHERRQREIESQRVAILQAARKLALQDGWPHVTIRKISAEIEYTAPLIYERFENKEAILLELEASGFRQLRTALEDARSSKRDPEQQLLAMTGACWDWAFANRELYQVMFNLEGIQSPVASPAALGESAAPVLDCIRQIHLFAVHTEALFLTWWALVHGSVSLLMSGQAGLPPALMRQYLLEGVQRLLTSMR